MASPGMMQSGLSRQLFEAWCTDKRNGVLIAGYCVEGTLAKVHDILIVLQSCTTTFKVVGIFDPHSRFNAHKLCLEMVRTNHHHHRQVCMGTSL